ncbi:ureidoglycolate lyase [uncultured Nisaea sp.]|uniref:ureidoglycolate lyase n=1 Tax=uncultured Nisaea sp. TaxID=538215 RepID=UPI0030EFA46B|tara:strand:- start:777 stop:1268 length:492 start_codon:yes stop_codon:yes gene_type:complete
MRRTIRAEPLTAEGFAPFGDVLEATGTPDFMINAGLCGRHHDLARPETDTDGTLSLSVGRSEAITLPLSLGMMERHPHGSQAFVPMAGTQFLVIVAGDEDGTPGTPRAFLTNGSQGIQYRMNCWHGVLAPLAGPADFLIVDRVGPGDNLEEHHLAEPYTIVTD